MLILRFAGVRLDQSISSGRTGCENAADIECSDRSWVFGIGWTLCIIALLIIIIAALSELANQIDYGLWSVSYAIRSIQHYI